MSLPWQLVITRVENGYLLEWKEESENIEGTLLYYQKVIQEHETDLLKDHEELLWEVLDFFAFGGSKHNESRIRIIREKNAG